MGWRPRAVHTLRAIASPEAGGGGLRPGAGRRAWMYKGEDPEPGEESAPISDLLSGVGGSQLPSFGEVWKDPW